MKMLKRGLFALLALALTVALVACGSKAGSFSVNKKIVCEVDGEAITYDDYKYFFYNHYKALYDTTAFKDLSSEEQFEKVKSLTEDSLRRRAYIMYLVDEYDIELSDTKKEYVDNYVNAYIEDCGGDTAYKKSLLENGMTGDVFRAQVELTYGYDVALRELLTTGVDNRVPMTDEAIIEDVTGGGFYRYSQIYFSVDAGELDTDAKTKINEAHTLLNSGKNFAEVAKKCKSDWSIDAEKGMYIAKGEKDDLLESTLEGLEVGEYSEPKWSGEGWHIFIRLPIDRQFVEENLYEPIDSGYSIADKSFAHRYLDYIANGSKSIEIEYAKYFENKITYAMLIKTESINDID